jgi:hypothetical protein
LESADNPGDWSDMLMSGSELDAIPADGVDSRVAFRDGPNRPARGLVRFLYSSNPFYILSADLVFVGLRLSFGAGGPASRTVALLVGLGGYTLLLATTACVLIRLGDLWDDLRSLLLLIVMILMAIAMSGDDVMAADPGKGAVVCLGGFLFAAVVTEAVLRVIRLRLPGWYRTAYYLIMALVFLYPLALAPFLTKPDSPSLQWALFGFSPLAGLALTALVPAARAGRPHIARNGSPWRWPLYPWSLFVVMALGLAIRCSTLCVSFHFVGGHDTIFGPYFLVPIGLAVSLVWLEIGIASGGRRVMFAASSAPLALVLLAMTGHRYDAVYQHFLGLFMTTLGGSPAFVSLIAATLFFVYAVARGVPLAWELLSAGLLALTVVGPRTVDVFETVSPRWLPLLAAGQALGFAAWRHRDSRRATIAAGFLVAGITLGWPVFFPHADRAVISIHLILVAFLIIGAVFDDRLAGTMRACGALLLLTLGFVSAIGYAQVSGSLPVVLAPYYPALLAGVACGYGFLVRDRTYLDGAVVSLAVWLGWSGWRGYAQLRKGVAGLDHIVLGLVFFSLAMAISLRKAGVRPGPMAKPLARLFEAYRGPAWRARRASGLKR